MGNPGERAAGSGERAGAEAAASSAAEDDNEPPPGARGEAIIKGVARAMTLMTRALDGQEHRVDRQEHTRV